VDFVRPNGDLQDVWLTSQGNGIELAAKDWRVWAASRVFTGMGNGLVQTQCVIYIAECAPIAIRGTLLASYAFAYQIGGLTGAIGLQVLQTVSSPHYTEYKADQ
jgi:SP family general alpha glucoside:H+ symporter-like MFS transporter